MGQPPSATERLTEFLAQLPPQTQAMLSREFERAAAQGEDAAVATFVLAHLRKVMQGNPPPDPVQQPPDPAELVFAFLGPLLIDDAPQSPPGRIRRSSLHPIWLWLKREAIPTEIGALESAIAEGSDPAVLEVLVRQTHAAVVAAVAAVVDARGSATTGKVSFARLGSPAVVEDLLSLRPLLGARDAVDGFLQRIPAVFRMFTDSQIHRIVGALAQPTLSTPQMLPFMMSLIMARLSAPWQIIRLAIKIAGTDDATRVAGTPYGVAVTIAIQDLARIAHELRTDIKRGHFRNTGTLLKALHDGSRGLRTELDIRPDSLWGRQLSALRAELSKALQLEIEGVPGRVRRLLRQRADKDVLVGARLDEIEVNETEALIEFVAACRIYASELAINEVTLRTFSDLQHTIEISTESLVDSLRACNPRMLGYRRQQVDAAIRFCAIVFGEEYAQLQRKAAGIAQSAEQKPQLAEKAG